GKKRDRPAAQLAGHAQIVDAVQMIGMRVGQQHRVDPRGAGIEHLLAQIGRHVDQEVGAAALDQHRAAAAAVARVGRIPAPPPPGPRSRARCPSAGGPIFCPPPPAPPPTGGWVLGGGSAAGGVAFANSRKNLSVVAAASPSGAPPLSAATAAAVAATKAGSL